MPHCRLSVAVIVLFGVVGPGVSDSAVLVPPKSTSCGDVTGGPWVVRDRLSGKGLTGSHYTVATVNFPCSKARTLVAKVTRMRSLGPGPSALLPGFMCLTGIPAGQQAQHGGCSVGTSPILLPTAGIKSFKWQACVAIPSRREHMSCTTRKLP
jgi:hypothetical protein